MSSGTASSSTAPLNWGWQVPNGMRFKYTLDGSPGPLDVLNYALAGAGGFVGNFGAFGKASSGLANDVASTFMFGRYSEHVLSNPMVLGRYYDNINAFEKGRFMTDSISGFTFLDRIGLALRPSWNGMTNVAYWEIPAGSTVYQGRAAMQFPWLGGKTQYFVPELGNITRINR
jgi:hypothetical protein